MRCRRICARPSRRRAKRCCTIALRPDLSVATAEAFGKTARQAIAVDLPAQDGQPVAARDRACCTRRLRPRRERFAEMDAAGLAAAHQCRSGPPRRHGAARTRDLHRRRHFIRCDRRNLHAPPPARRVRRRRDAGLGSADRRLSAAGVVCHRRRCGARRAGVARPRFENAVRIGPCASKEKSPLSSAPGNRPARGWATAAPRCCASRRKAQP